MTTYRLMDGASGRPGVGSSGTQPPAAGTSYSGSYIAGLIWQVTSGSLWFQGYWWWVAASNQDTAAMKFALWQVSGSGTGTLVPGSVVTSGTLTAGQWNYVALPTPLLLSANIPYNAAAGGTFSHGFPDTQNQFGGSNPYATGITNGPLNAYYGSSSADGFLPQSPFSTAGADPSTTMPATNDANDLLWLDVQVSDTAPSGTLSYRAWPNMPATWPAVETGTDTTGYTLGMEFSLSQSCTLDKIWHYSVPGVSTVLPSRCGLWNVGSQAEVAGTDNSSPTWLDPGGGAASAGDGWVYCDYSASGVTLAASTNYKVSTYHAAGSTWFGATPSVWGTSELQASGFTQGPLIVPGNAAATPGQQSWNTLTWAYPATSTNPEVDWIDIEVTPVTVTPAAVLYQMRSFP